MPSRRGLSLVECLIGLALTAALLTAAGAAFVASSAAVEHNDQFFRATQAARITINKTMADVRSCQSGVVGTDALELLFPDGVEHTVSYDSTNRTIQLTIDDGVTPVTHPIARNVQSAQFTTNGRLIAMTVTVQVGRNSVTLTGSAMPRRTLTYR